MRISHAILFALSLGCASSGRQRDLGPGRGWAVLGTRAVTDRVDHDVIPVTGSRGDFRAIKIGVVRAAVDFHRVVVHYANGRQESIELRNTIPAGGESRVIDLAGSDRVINRIEFWYDARTIRGRQATVRVLGLR